MKTPAQVKAAHPLPVSPSLSYLGLPHGPVLQLRLLQDCGARLFGGGWLLVSRKSQDVVPERDFSQIPMCVGGGGANRQSEAGVGRPLDEVGKQHAVGEALPPDLGRLQHSGVAQLDQHLLPVKLVGLSVVVGFDAADKVRLAGHHLGKQVHQRVLDKMSEWRRFGQMS